MSYWEQWHQTFEKYVAQANPHFERFALFKSSSLRPLIDELRRGANARVPTITAHLRTLQGVPDAQYRTKANKYKDALYHLVQTLKIEADFSPGHVDATRVCLFARCAVPVTFAPISRGDGGRAADYQPTRPERRDVTRMLVPSSLRDLIAEDSIARGWIDGIVVIHMYGFVAGPMNRKFDGWRVIDHMNSALRVGRQAGVPLAVVTIDGRETCSELKVALNYPDSQKFSSQQGEHAGWHDPGFRAWMTGKRRVLVMGYDGAVCVRANLFGCPETVESAAGVGPDVGRIYRPHDRTEYKAVRPLVSVASVETSRALLATGAEDAVLNPANHVGEYGPLFGL